MSDVESHLAALEETQEQGRLTPEDAERITALAEAIKKTRPTVEDTLTGEPHQESSEEPPEEPLIPLSAPAIIRPRTEMKTAERLEIGLQNYTGPGKIAAFFGWIHSDGTAKEGDSRALETANVDKLIKTFGSSDQLVAALHWMEQEPELTLGPDYGDDQLNFIAMILAMNRTKGRTLQKVDAYVHPIYGDITPQILHGKPILGYRPAFIDGVQKLGTYTNDKNKSRWHDRLAAREQFLKDKPITGTDRLAYVDLVALKLATQKPIDRIKPPRESRGTYTIFESDDALSPGSVLYGFFNTDSGQPIFNSIHSGNIHGGARFRSVLVSDVVLR